MNGLIAVGGGDESVRVFRVEGIEGEETIQEVTEYFLTQSSIPSLF